MRGDATDRAGRMPYADGRLSVELEKPAWYPFQSIARSGLLVCLEGHVYGHPSASLLTSLAGLNPAFDDDEAFARRLRSCANAVEGDFILLWYDADSGRLGITGDRYGRLPFYYRASERCVYASRSQGYVLSHIEHASTDRTALAQLLAFGYPLGNRTLAEGVSRLLPGEVLLASITGSTVISPSESPFRRRPDTRVPPTMAACAKKLRDAFVSSCRDRWIEADRHVLSLSGGIDSRTTGAGMRAVLRPFAAVTFVAPGSVHADERTSARAVAQVLGADWRAYEFDHADPTCIDQIIRMKIGLSPIHVAFGIEYVRRVQADGGRAVAFWTGEGADKLLCEHRAIPPHPTPDELVRYIVVKNSVLDLRHVAAMTGVHVDDLHGTVRSTVDSLDGVDPVDAYVHFLLSQRVVRWHLEGEDRHRSSVWPITPFFGADFFALARAAPGRWKRGRRLYRAFLAALSPDVAGLPLAGGHAAPASRLFALEYAVREHFRDSSLASMSYQRIRRARRSRQGFDEPWRESLAQMVRDATIPPPFVASGVRDIATGRTVVPPGAMSQILTSVLAVRHLGKSG